MKAVTIDEISTRFPVFVGKLVEDYESAEELGWFVHDEICGGSGLPMKGRDFIECAEFLSWLDDQGDLIYI